MAFHLKSLLIIFATWLVIMQMAKGQDEPPKKSEEDNNYSPGKTIKEANESSKRQRRSLESSVEAADSSEGQTKASALPMLPSIPGLPDPETILKIAEILTTVGQQVLPIFVSGNSGLSDFVTNRASHDMKFLKKFKNELDLLSGQLNKNKKR